MRGTTSLALLAGLFLGATPETRESPVGTIEGFVRDPNAAPIAGARVTVEGSGARTSTDRAGRYVLTGVPAGPVDLTVRAVGYVLERRRIDLGSGQRRTVDFVLAPVPVSLDDLVIAEARPVSPRSEKLRAVQSVAAAPYLLRDFNTEEYRHFRDNDWTSPTRQPLSTFAVDVDAGSYGNVRRFLKEGRLPPKDAVRVEEMINYFRYDYAAPRGGHPVAVTTELARSPWNSNHRLALIGLQTDRLPLENLPPSNLVFLIDVSGSMSSPDKLPLVKAAFRLLVNELRDSDRVAIVVYAGAAGVVLPSTSGREKTRILDALEQLQAGGSTAGGAGIKLAYQVAREHFAREGNNRVILASDGDFNVGASSEGELVRLIETERQGGVFLTVLGFGTGNLKDAKMEQLANKGNGHYAYVDDLLEAKKVFVQELGATLHTVAKDVKIQVEFNPARVKSYRLVGYENRLLADRDFNDDTKDAGEMGAGHSVTALYEIVPVDGSDQGGSVDPLKYQRSRTAGGSDDWFTVKVRYQRPEGSASRLIEHVVRQETARPSADFRFAGAVAGFGMLLRDSEHKGNASFDSVIAAARGAKGADAEGYRAEFIRLAEMAARLGPPSRELSEGRPDRW